MKAEESGGAYTSLGTRQEGGRFEDIGLSICASPLRILVLGLRRAEFRRSAVGPKVSRGVRETEEMEEFTGSIQCDIQTEELPPQHAQYLYLVICMGVGACGYGWGLASPHPPTHRATHRHPCGCGIQSFNLQVPTNHHYTTKSNQHYTT